jgi:uncharacterized cupin superfamily protein
MDLLPPFAIAAANVELEPGELAADQVLDGQPRVRLRRLWTSADGCQEAGIWEITPGTVTDVEADEVFVVLSGDATVELADGRSLELSPGVAGTFPAGTRTTWRVHETLRKLYCITVG